MSDKPIEPFEVMLAVENWVEGELMDSRKYTNREPLDGSGVYSLHDLAATIYAMGWKQGHLAGSDAQHRQARREREAAARSTPADVGQGHDNGQTGTESTHG